MTYITPYMTELLEALALIILIAHYAAHARKELAEAMKLQESVSNNSRLRIIAVYLLAMAPIIYYVIEFSHCVSHLA